MIEWSVTPVGSYLQVKVSNPANGKVALLDVSHFMAKRLEHDAATLEHIIVRLSKNVED